MINSYFGIDSHLSVVQLMVVQVGHIAELVVELIQVVHERVHQDGHVYVHNNVKVEDKAGHQSVQRIVIVFQDAVI